MGKEDYRLVQQQYVHDDLCRQRCAQLRERELESRAWAAEARVAELLADAQLLSRTLDMERHEKREAWSAAQEARPCRMVILAPRARAGFLLLHRFAA